MNQDSKRTLESVSLRTGLLLALVLAGVAIAAACLLVVLSLAKALCW